MVAILSTKIDVVRARLSDGLQGIGKLEYRE
jgi:hypothetical protein